MKRAYISPFDTLNFYRDDLSNEATLYRITQIRASIFNLFYTLDFSPNQVLDSRWLQEQLLSTAPDEWPEYNFSVNVEFINSPNPFSLQYASFLDRPGKDSFLWSSEADAERKAKDWGHHRKTLKQRISALDLIEEARGIYPSKTTFVKKLDKAHRKFGLRVIPYTPRPYKEVALDLIKGVPHQPLKRVGSSRSSTIKMAKEDAAGDAELLKHYMMQINLASNVNYAKNLGKATANVEDEENRTSFGKGASSDPSDASPFVIDLDHFLTTYPAVEEALEERPKKEVDKARHAASRLVENAWKVADTDKAGAVEQLREALGRFGSRLIGQTIKLPSLIGRTSISPISGTQSVEWELTGADKLLPSYKKTIQYIKLKYGWKKGSLDQVINMK